MDSRPTANNGPNYLLNLIERRFGLQLSVDSTKHLRMVQEHYSQKRELILWEHGEADAIKRNEYAKAVLISETARLMLREIDPWPRRKKSKRK